MNESFNLYLEKLKKKNEMLEEIYKYTSSKEFKVDESEIQHIENYLLKRKKLYKNLLLLDEEIKGIKLSNTEKDNIEIKNIISENDKLINSILQLDKHNENKLKQISNLLRGNIKAIKNTKKVSENYFGGICNTYSTGNYFDIKR